jgi:hypothetical protein
MQYVAMTGDFPAKRMFHRCVKILLFSSTSRAENQHFNK